MSLRERLDKFRTSQPKEPGFLALQGTILPLAILLASKIIIRIENGVSSTIRTKTKDRPSTNENGETVMTVYKGSTVAVEAGGKSTVFAAKHHVGIVTYGGDVREGEKGGYFINDKKRKTRRLTKNNPNFRLGKIKATFEPD